MKNLYVFLMLSWMIGLGGCATTQDAGESLYRPPKVGVWADTTKNQLYYACMNVLMENGYTISSKYSSAIEGVVVTDELTLTKPKLFGEESVIYSLSFIINEDSEGDTTLYIHVAVRPKNSSIINVKYYPDDLRLKFGAEISRSLNSIMYKLENYLGPAKNIERVRFNWQ